MASEIRVNKIENRSGLGTVTFADTGVDLAGITTVATLRATTGIVTSLTAVSSAKVGSGVTLSPDGDLFATGVTTSTTFVGNLTGDVTGTASGNTTLSNGANNRIITASSASALQGETNFTFDGNNILKIDTGQTYAYLQLDGSSGGSIEFYDDGTRKFEIYGIDAGVEIYDREKGAYHSKFLSGGNVEISDGDLVIGTSGHGISFSATGEGSNTSSEGELLDDYEEGTCTIAMQDAVGSNISVTNIGCNYTKIGNRVFVEGKFTFAESGSKNGGLMTLYQLPYAVATNAFVAGNYWYDATSDANDITGLVYAHTNGSCYLKQSTTQGQPSNNKYLTFNEIEANNNRSIFFSFNYTTTS